MFFAKFVNMRNLKLFFAVSFTALSLIRVDAQSPAVKNSPEKSKAQKYIESVAANDVLRGSTFGVLAVTEGGCEIASWNPAQRQVPASTMKLITTGAAMHQLGPDFKFTTRLGYIGEIKDGTLEGDLYIVGGGAKNTFLNELTEWTTGKQVVALPIEATALGNLKVQMEADK